MSPKESIPVFLARLNERFDVMQHLRETWNHVTPAKALVSTAHSAKYPGNDIPQKHSMRSTITNDSALIYRYIRAMESRLVSLEYSIQTKAHVSEQEHSPPAPRHAEDGDVETSPQFLNRRYPHQNESVKLISRSRNHPDRLPPVGAIHASPPVSTEKEESTDCFLPQYHSPAHRHDPLPSHSCHQSQHDHHIPSDRRESIDHSQWTHSVHERPSFNDTIDRRPWTLSLVEKPIPLSAGIIIDDGALNRYSPLNYTF